MKKIIFVKLVIVILFFTLFACKNSKKDFTGPGIATANSVCRSGDEYFAFSRFGKKFHYAVPVKLKKGVTVCLSNEPISKNDSVFVLEGMILGH